MCQTHVLQQHLVATYQSIFMTHFIKLHKIIVNILPDVTILHKHTTLTAMNKWKLILSHKSGCDVEIDVSSG